MAFLQKNGKEMRYSANQMSDGERSVLYLASQVLCVPKNKILIIDEPEIHLHRSIMNRLWKALEKHRQDCLLFILHMIRNLLQCMEMQIKYGFKIMMASTGNLRK